MAQHDLDVANGSGSTVRADINSALVALGSLQKGASAPGSAAAGWFWLDDDTPSSSLWTLKQYDGSDWLHVGYVDTTNNRFIGAGALIGVRTFATPGASTYTPTTGTRAIRVRVQAGGGGSGGCVATTAGQWAAGRPGASGAYAEAYLTSGFSGVTITVGAGGVAGSAGDNGGGTGGTSSFGTAVVCAGGGGGGGSGNVATGAGLTIGNTAAGGVASDGDINVPGNSPDAPFAVTVGLVVRAAGGDAVLGPGGSSAVVSTNNASGSTPGGYGGGAAGPVNANNTFSAAAGAAGAPGVIIIEEFG
jgi:hypothetical protein